MAELFYNEILIRNIDCGVLYFQIKDDEKIKLYEQLKKEKVELEDSDNPDEERYIKVQKEIEELSNKIFSFEKPIKLSDKNNRFYYSGTLPDSLMARKLREEAKKRKDTDAIKTFGNSDYTDLIINLKFKQDIMIPDDTPKWRYNPETNSIEELKEKKMKRLISKKKLRKMAYKDGITINGVKYVNYQRSSSKARIGNDLFIKEDYFDEMEKWQNLDIPFSELTEADIVSICSYRSLTSSSIIGELGIDPYSILLIDDVSGEYTMPCNVVRPVVSENGKGTELEVFEEDYTQRTDLWDGQSLLDSSVFKNGKYVEKDKDGKIVKHSYDSYGFMLLRNHFFKSAAFNTNLQEYYKERFKDEENPVIYDEFGNPFETKNVLMVTTKNSVKIFKFSDVICKYKIDDCKKAHLKELEKPLIEKCEELQKAKQDITTAKRKLTMLLNYDSEKGKEPPTQDDIDLAIENINEAERYYNENYERLEDEIKPLLEPVKKEQDRLTWDWYREQIKEQNFGVCKTEHKSKLGDRQNLWYQIFVSLNFNKDELWELVKPQVEEINLMRKYVAWFKRTIDMREQDKVGDSMMLALLKCNEDISRTKWYTNYRHSKIQGMIKKLLAGKIQIKDSDFNVLFGNPYEMLRASCGDKIDTSILKDFECYCPRYEDNEELYGFRSPHICTGNNALLKNTWRKEWKWFNLTDNILIINLWGKGAFLSCKWNGSDQDSDTAYIGNNPIILKKVKEVQNDYLIPINEVPQEPKMYEFTNENMAKVDGQLSNDMIGKICNLARDLSSLYWHLYNDGTSKNKQEYLPIMYRDICLLEVLSNIAIDSAKRQYKCNIESEMKKIKSRPYMNVEGAVIRDNKIVFTQKRYKKSLSENSIADYEDCLKDRENATSQEEVDAINEKIDKILKVENVYMIRPDFTKNLKSQPKRKKKYKKDESEEQKELRRKKQESYAQEQKAIMEKVYRKLESPMDILKEVIYEHLERSPKTKYIPLFTDILAPIPKGSKADYNRIEKIKEVCIEAKKKIDCKQSEYDSGKISFDEMLEGKKSIQSDIINDLKSRKVTTLDINKLIRDTYDQHPEKNEHGRVIKLSNGKPKMADARDKKLIKNEAGGWMLQWLYSAHKDEFLKAIKKNKGDVSYVRKYEPDKDVTSKISSLKDIKKLIKPESEIVTWDGVEYEIVTRKSN